MFGVIYFQRSDQVTVQRVEKSILRLTLFQKHFKTSQHLQTDCFDSPPKLLVIEYKSTINY